MSYMTNFETAEDFQTFMRDAVRNLPGTPEPHDQNAANFSPGTFTRTESTPSQELSLNIDPSLRSESNADIMGPGSSVAPEPPHQIPPRRQSARQQARRNAAQDQITPRVQKSRARNAPKKLPTRSDESGIKGQDAKPCPHCCPTSRAEETPEAAGMDELSDGIVASDKIRWRGKAMQWLDEQDHRWKPARYHRHCRDKLIARAAQQPGAPVWNKNMGTDYTSFSPLTKDWTDDPQTVVDSKGRQVLFMNSYPPNWDSRPKYGRLIIDGKIILDHRSKPVRDIPGLPLTLNSDPPGWLLEGLRRCTKIEIEDFMARCPGTRVTKSGVKKRLQGNTAFTNRMRRWQKSRGYELWNDRPGAKRSQTPSTIPSADEDESQKRTVISEFEDAMASSWEPSDSEESGGQAERGHLPFSQPCSSAFGSQYVPYCNNNFFNGENHDEDKGLERNDFGHEGPRWNPDDTGRPVPWMGSELGLQAELHPYIPEVPKEYGVQSTVFPTSRGSGYNQAYNYGYHIPSPQPENQFFPNVAYFQNTAPMPSFESPGQLQTYGTQILPSTETQNNLVSYAALDYTRVEYNSWTPEAPPESSFAGQRREMQAHLERAWSFPEFPPMNLAAMGPMSGGVDHW